MTEDTFQILLKELLTYFVETLSTKNEDYASKSDKLHNFKRTARFLNCSPQKALMGFWAKHATSIVDIVDRGKHPDMDVLREKVGDAINYLILLYALYQEEEDARNSLN